MQIDSIDREQSDQLSTSRLAKLAAVLACMALAALAWKLSPMANPDQAKRRAAEAEIALCRDDQERMFLTPERARIQGAKCAKLEVEYQRRFR